MLSRAQEDMFRLYVLMVAEKMSLPPTIVPITISTLNDVEPFCGTDYRFRTRDHLRRASYRWQLHRNMHPPEQACASWTWSTSAPGC